MKRADGILVTGEAMRRHVLNRVGEIYKLELEGKQYAYDGGRSLFSVAPLFEDNLLQLNVIVEDVYVLYIYLGFSVYKMLCLFFDWKETTFAFQSDL